MGRMLTTLAEQGEIRFDMSPFTRRDFIPVENAGRAIAALLQAPPGGVVNVGSGIPLECGRLALWLLEGFGRGHLVCESWQERDAFVLAVDRLRRLTGVTCDEAVLRETCVGLGPSLPGARRPSTAPARGIVAGQDGSEHDRPARSLSTSCSKPSNDRRLAPMHGPDGKR
jgi:hypothetical protein